MSNYWNSEYARKKAVATKEKWEAIIANNSKYPCNKCGKEKPAEAFVIQYISNQYVGKFRYLYECRECKKARIYAKRDKKRTNIGWAMEIIIQQLLQWAKKRKITFAITKKDLLSLWEKQQGLCYYSGYEMQFGFVGYKHTKLHEKAKFQVSCDRIVNDQWYVPGNIVLCCNFVNKMKWTLSEQEFYTTCHDIWKLSQLKERSRS